MSQYNRMTKAQLLDELEAQQGSRERLEAILDGTVDLRLRFARYGRIDPETESRSAAFIDLHVNSTSCPSAPWNARRRRKPCRIARSSYMRSPADRPSG